MTERSDRGKARPSLRPGPLLALVAVALFLSVATISFTDGWPVGKIAWADDDGDDADGGDDSDDGADGSDDSDDDDSDDDDGDDGSDGGSGASDDDDGDDGGDEDDGDAGSEDGDDGEEKDEDEEEARFPGRPSPLPRARAGEVGDPETARDTILVVDLTPTDIALVEGRGFRIRDAQRLLGLDLGVMRLRPPPGMDVERARAELRRLVPERTVDLEHVYRLNRGGCGEEDCWPLRLVDWTDGGRSCSPETPIGMIDTGVDRTRPALRNAAVTVRQLIEGERADPAHGTAIASLLVGGRGGGLLPGARLLVADVFTVDREGPVTGPLEIVRGLDWLVRRGASPVNLSLAGPDNAVLRLAVERALARGVVLVAAAGNGGPQAAPAYPGAYPGVIAVTAVDRRLRPYVRANRGSYIAFAAPGVGLLAAEGLPVLSGTSYATPFVTAAAALLLADGRPRTPATLEAELALRAQDLGPPGRDPVFGWGLVRHPRRCPR